ncbi:MAG TPA: hypothetical protein VHP60_00655, partial [Thermoanaerobaculia bacterium]|nr:hypothetical protein [Thermoanaerobaculia bacterium]
MTLAGAAGTTLPRFLAFTSAGTLIWAGAALSLGLVFHVAIDRVLAFLATLGSGAIVLLGGAAESREKREDSV